MTDEQRKCEACGLLASFTLVRTTNGALSLCGQCLDDVNRKNPEVARLKLLVEAWRFYVQLAADWTSDEYASRARAALALEKEADHA